MSKLNEVLNQMFNDGTMRSQVPQNWKLKSGLYINLTCHSSGVTFEIARDNTFPSLKEWKTCLANFPYHTGRVQPSQKILTDGRRVLFAELPNRRQVAEQNFRTMPDDEPPGSDYQSSRRK